MEFKCEVCSPRGTKSVTLLWVTEVSDNGQYGEMDEEQETSQGLEPPKPRAKTGLRRKGQLRVPSAMELSRRMRNEN